MNILEIYNEIQTLVDNEPFSKEYIKVELSREEWRVVMGALEIAGEM